MTVDDSIAFRFYTRTRSENYRVFAGDGHEVMNYAEEFAPIQVMANVADDDEQSAAIFEDGGNVYVAAFGLRPGRQDRARRDIRFSFCVTVPGAKRSAAMRIFSRLKDEWDETGKFAGSLITEIPTTRKDWQGREKPGEDVRFDQRKFLHWLTERPANVQAPRAGYMLKYSADTGETVPKRTGGPQRNEDEDMPGQHRREHVQPARRNWSAISLFVVCVVLGILCFVSQTNLNEALQRADKAEKAVQVLSDDLGHARVEISSLKKSLNVTQQSLDKSRQEITTLKQEVDRLKKAPAKSGGGNPPAQKKTEEEASKEVPQPEKAASSGCESGIVSAGILPFVYLASQGKGQLTSQDVTNNKEAANVEQNQAGDNVIKSGDNENHNNDFSLDIHGDNGGAVSPGSGNNAASQRDKGNTQPSVQTQTSPR